MAQCRGVKRDKSQCTATVDPPQEYCWWHDSATSEARQRAASKGGKGKAGKVVKDLHKLLQDATNDVIDGALSYSRGAVVAQLVNARVRLLEYERRVREEEELIQRIEQLERAQEQRGGKRWGA